MRVATWNVNSIRTRLDRVTDWLARADIDVLAMQETKCSDSQFPTLPFFELGYEVAHVGFNQWNGVAIASRVGLDDVQIGFDGQPTCSSRPDVAATAEARALGAICGGVRVWSLYVPNGRTLDDPHYLYKLDWLAALRDTAAGWLRDDPAAPIFPGDWNIAPTDEDVLQLPNSSPGPRMFPSRNVRRSMPSPKAQFTDVVRPFTPGPDVYTYWDYTQLALPKKTGHANRLHSRFAGVGSAGNRCPDRPRRTQGQGIQRPRTGAGRRAQRITHGPAPARPSLDTVARCLDVCDMAGLTRQAFECKPPLTIA